MLVLLSPAARSWLPRLTNRFTSFPFCILKYVAIASLGCLHYILQLAKESLSFLSLLCRLSSPTSALYFHYGSRPATLTKACTSERLLAVININSILICSCIRKELCKPQLEQTECLLLLQTRIF